MRFRHLHFAAVSLFFSLSCDESLPPRQDPSDLFGLAVWSYYNYTPIANNIVIHAALVNNFDETLNGPADISGSFLVTSERDSSVHATVPMLATNIIHATYAPGTGILTVDPGDSVVLETAWDFTDESGRSLDSTVFFRYTGDTTCVQRLIAQPEAFAIAGKIRLFQNLGFAQSATVIRLRHYNIFVSSHDCLRK